MEKWILLTRPHSCVRRSHIVPLDQSETQKREDTQMQKKVYKAACAINKITS